MTDAVDNRFVSRKWSLTVGVVLIAMIARGVSWIDGAQFVSLLTWIVGLYMVGDVGSSIAGGIAITGKTATTPSAVPPAGANPQPRGTK